MSQITIFSGAITTAYGAYSYCTAKGKQRNKQKETAMRVMAVGVGLIAVGAALHYFGKIQEPETIAPDYLKPYVNALKGQSLPKVRPPLTEFPPHLSQFPHPALLATQDGGTCVIDELRSLPPLEECEQRLAPFVQEIKETMPDVYAAGTAHSSRWGKGYQFKIQKPGFNSFTFGMDKSIVSNYAKSLQVAERHFLQDPDFASRSDSSIVDSIKEMHKALAENVQHQDPGSQIHPGAWRTIQLLVADGKMEMSKSGMMRYLQAQNAPKADYGHLESWFAKRDKYGSTEAAWPHFSPEELATLKKVVHLPKHFEEIPSAMLGYAKRLKEIYSLVKNRIVHPVPAAAWVHQECGDIHPFADINGRGCRTLANSVLQWGGIKGVIFPNDEVYTAVAQADQRTPGSFALYLLKIIKWNSEQKAFQV